MIIQGENDQVIGNAGETKTFTIAASAKAFKVLSSNIYKNKIRAVVRELVCNAVDAHVINSNSAPYEIQGPNLLDPRFIVRDFGPGLSDEDMIELYTTYFASTKANRNDQIGALGLGSKSPFSYTSTFSVVSYFEGMVRVYSCMLSNGEPAIVKTHEEPFNDTDKPGIEVIVPVKIDDISKWHSEISYVMRPFPSNSYEIKGILDFNVDSFDKMPQYSKNWFGVRQANHNSGVYAVYGNIVYPLRDIDGMDASWLGHSYKTVYIHFDLGELDIQPSREELSLDETTVANICKRVNSLNEFEREKDLDVIRALINPREVARHLNSMSAGAFTALTNSKIKFLGKTVSELTSGHDLTRIELGINQAGRLYEYSYGKAIPKKGVTKTSGSYRRFRASEVNLANVYSYKQKRAFILINDCKKSIQTTMKGLYASTDVNHPTQDEYIYMTFEGDPRAVDVIKEIRSTMGMDEVITLRSSELEEIRKLVANYGVKRTRDNAPRPASPNGVRYTWSDAAKMYTAQELFMNAHEVDELEGYVIGQYRDTPAALHDNFNLICGIEIARIKTMAKYMHVREFTMVRPSIWDKVKRNENVECLFLEAFQQLKYLTKEVRKNEVYYLSPKSRLCNKLTKHECLNFMIKEFTRTGNPKAQEYNAWANRFVDIRFSNQTTFARLVKIYVTKWKTAMEAAEKDYRHNYAEFKKSNPLIEFYLAEKYDISDKDAMKVAEQYKLLNPNK